MGDAVVKLILKDLNDLVLQEVKLLIKVRPQLESLKTQLNSVSAFLRAFDSRGGMNEQDATGWVGELRDAAYEAQDIIEECSQKIDQQKRLGITGSLLNFILCVSETFARHQLGEQIQNLTSKIKDLLSQRSLLGIDLEQDAETFSADANNTPSELQKAAIAKGIDMVGFVDVENRIIGELLQNQGQRTCVSVVGMGGLGKTTITKKIYSNSAIENQFKFRAWITVSRRYKEDVLLRGILKGILDCIPSGNVEKQDIAKLDTGGLVIKLQQLLADVTYLVVVDDIWQCEAWDIINAALPDNSMGSKVILTTRNKEVAQGTTFELPFLSEEESWVLFCKKAFPKTVCPPELEDMGRQVVKRCRGLPLAIIVLGGMLSRKHQKRYEWQKIRDHLSHELNIQKDEMIKKILSLSYHDLSYELKLCFLYMGLFPEDTEIDAVKLAHLWIAEGFIQQKDRKTMEEIAEIYLEDLASRCIIQVVETDPLGRVARCRIHDLLLDLACKEGGQMRFLDVHQDERDLHEVKSRRLAIHRDISLCASSKKCLIPKLHSLICFDLRDAQHLNEVFSLTLLRAIDLEGAPLKILPKEIENMVHLRFLGLRRTKLTSIPSSIGKLIKLETLNVMDIEQILLPKTVWKIKTLRHIHASNLKPPIVCDKLRNLQTLHTATAGEWITKSLRQFINLRKLGISEVSHSHEMVICDSIGKVTNLSFLELQGTSIPNVFGMDLKEHGSLRYLSLEGIIAKSPQSNQKNLAPNLTQITLDQTELDMDPSPLLGGLPDLCIVRLFTKSFVGEEIVCCSGGFPKLQELYFCGLPELKRWTLEEGAMRCLKILTLKDCKNLEMLPERLHMVTTLKEVTFDDMASNFLKRIERDGEDWHKIQHVSEIKIF